MIPIRKAYFFDFTCFYFSKFKKFYFCFRETPGFVFKYSDSARIFPTAHDYRTEWRPPTLPRSMRRYGRNGNGLLRSRESRASATAAA